MSLSLHKQLYVAVCVDRLGIVLVSGGFVRRIVEQVVIPVENWSDAPTWQAPIAALSRWLESRRLSGAILHLTFADEFVRYAIAPWSEDIRGEREWQQLAGACFESIYGKPDRSWAFRIEAVEEGKPALACALEQEALATIQVLCRQHRLRLYSLQPTLIRGTSRWCKELPESAGLILSVSDKIFVGLVYEDAACTQVWTQHFPESIDAQDLQTICQREILLRGLPTDTKVTVLCINSNRWDQLSMMTGAQVLPVTSSPSLKFDRDRAFPLELAQCVI